MCGGSDDDEVGGLFQVRCLKRRMYIYMYFLYIYIYICIDLT